MKNFNVYQHSIKGYEVVKVGFSWPAFFFGLIWMLFKKLWGWALLWVGLAIVVSLLEEAAGINSETGMDSDITPAVAMFFMLVNGALWLIPPFQGNQWRENNLKNRGYKLVESISANNVDEAMAKLVNETNNEHS